MNFKTTLMLLVLLVIVGVYFVLFERGTPTTYEYEQQRRSQGDVEGRLLFDDLGDATVTRLTIARRGEPDDRAAVVVKTDGQWTQVEPVRFPLAAARPQQVADDAAALRTMESFTPGEDDGDRPTLQALSLHDPRVTLTLEAGDQMHTIRLGERSTGGRGYVTIDDDPKVYVVNDALHTALLDASIASWRDKSIEAPSLSQLDQLVLRSGDETTAAYKLDGRWFLDEQGTQRAGQEALSALLTSLGGIYISEFIADAPADPGVYGLNDPQLELSIVEPAVDGEAPIRRTLRIGAAADLKQETYYATWSTPRTAPEGGASDVVFTIRKSSVDGLHKSKADLRDPRIVITDADDVREMRISRRGMDDVTLQRTPQGWAFGDPAPTFGLDHESAKQLLAAVTEARATSYEPMLQLGEQPAATVELYRGGESAPERVSFFGPRESDEAPFYYSLRDGETVGYMVPAEQLDRVFAPVSALRDRTILNVTPQQLSRIDLTQPDGTALVFVRRQGEGDATSWQLQGAASFEATALDRLIESFAPLQVETWTTTRQSFEPNVTLTLHMAEGGGAHELQVETKTRRTMMADLPMFALPQSFVDRLTVEYRDRTALPMTLEQIESVTIESGGQTVTFGRDADRRYVDGDGEAVDQAMAAGVFDTLAGLRVRRWLAESGEAPGGVTITVNGVDGETRTLRLDRETRRGQFVGDERSFELAEQDVQKLMAPLMDDDQAQ